MEACRREAGVRRRAGDSPRWHGRERRSRELSLRKLGSVVIILVLAASCAEVLAAQPEGTARPRFATRCILRVVLARLDLATRDDRELPRVFFESTTALSQFQDATAPQWGFRAAAFANAYVASRNEIYLTDAASDYRRLGQSIDESLAHELTHYVQAKYLEMPLDDDPSIEFQAVDVQRWFRQTFLDGEPSRGPCELAVATRSRRIEVVAGPDPGEPLLLAASSFRRASGRADDGRAPPSPPRPAATAVADVVSARERRRSRRGRAHARGGIGVGRGWRSTTRERG